jgi:cytochrome c553
MISVLAIKRPRVAKLVEEDMLAIAAYLATQAP